MEDGLSPAWESFTQLHGVIYSASIDQHLAKYFVPFASRPAVGASRPQPRLDINGSARHSTTARLDPVNQRPASLHQSS